MRHTVVFTKKYLLKLWPWYISGILAVLLTNWLRVRTPEVQAGSDNATRVVRGGAWDGNARHARAADRHRFVPNNRLSDLGFRCVFSVG